MLFRGVTYMCVLYNVVSEYHSVQIPRWGVYSQLKVYFFCLAFAMPLCASFNMCLVVTCWERADLLDLVCGV